MKIEFGLSTVCFRLVKVVCSSTSVFSLGYRLKIARCKKLVYPINYFQEHSVFGVIEIYVFKCCKHLAKVFKVFFTAPLLK